MSSCRNIAHILDKHNLSQLHFAIRYGSNKHLGPLRLISFYSNENGRTDAFLYSEAHDTFIKANPENLTLIESDATRERLAALRARILGTLAINLAELTPLIHLGIFKEYLDGSPDASAMQSELIKSVTYSAATATKDSLHAIRTTTPDIVSPEDGEAAMTPDEFSTYFASVVEKAQARGDVQKPTRDETEALMLFIDQLFSGDGILTGRRHRR
jgi:hypothetical protein